MHSEKPESVEPKYLLLPLGGKLQDLLEISKLFTVFVVYIFLYLTTCLLFKELFKRQGDRVEGEIFHVLVTSPNTHNSQDLVRLKPATLPGSPLWVAGMQALGPSLAALLRSISRKLDEPVWSYLASDSTALIQYTGLPKQCVMYCAPTLVFMKFECTFFYL